MHSIAGSCFLGVLCCFPLVQVAINFYHQVRNCFDAKCIFHFAALKHLIWLVENLAHAKKNGRPRKNATDVFPRPVSTLESRCVHRRFCQRLWMPPNKRPPSCIVAYQKKKEWEISEKIHVNDIQTQIVSSSLGDSLEMSNLDKDLKITMPVKGGCEEFCVVNHTTAICIYTFAKFKLLVSCATHTNNINSCEFCG